MASLEPADHFLDDGTPHEALLATLRRAICRHRTGPLGNMQIGGSLSHPLGSLSLGFWKRIPSTEVRAPLPVSYVDVRFQHTGGDLRFFGSHIATLRI